MSQSYEDWELLLVDDGSKDSSTRIALDYAKKYPGKVRYFEHDSHKNMGMSASRNLGIHNAEGKYIALLDGDDVYLPNKLDQQVDILESTPDAALVYGPGLWWYDWTGKPEDLNRNFLQNLCVKMNTLINPPKLLRLMIENEESVPLPSSALIRREALHSVGCFEKSFRGMYEDQAFFAKIFLGMPVYASGNCWLKYRQHPDACCSVAKAKGQTYISRIKFLRWLIEAYLKQRRLKTPQFGKI